MKSLKLFTLLITFLLTGLIGNSQNLCSKPIGLTTTKITQTSAVVSWNKVPTAAYYVVAYGQTSINFTIQTVQDTTFLLTGLTAGTGYYWEVQSFCLVAGTSTYQESGYTPIMGFKTLAPPPPACNAPAIIQTTGITQTGATFTWSTADGACSYKGVYYPLNNTTVTSTPFTTTATSFTVSNLHANTSYRWLVQTICCSGSTSTNYSAQNFTTLPAPPTNCITPSIFSFDNATTTSCKIHWNKVAGACTYNIKYFQYYPAGAYPTDTLRATTQDSSYYIAALLPNTYYKYSIQTVCCNNIGTSPWSAMQYLKTLVPACNAPAQAQTTGITQTGATFTWSAVDGACSYKGTYYPLNNTTVTGTSFTTTVTSFTVSNLQPGTSYHWIVQTVCCSGNTSSAYIAQNFTTLPIPTCNAPTIGKTTNVTQTAATFTWSKVYGACAYNVTYFIYVSPSTTAKTINVTDTTTTVTGLVPGTYYHWRVQTVCCNNAQSPNSSDGIFTTSSPPACNAPATSLTTGITQNGATFTWSAADGACSYKGVYYPMNNTTVTSTPFTTTATSFTVSNLHANTSYRWLVQTICCSGNTSTNYTAQNFTTLPTPPPACATPTIFSVNNQTSSSGTIHWNKVAGACSYNIKYFQYYPNSTSPPDTLRASTKDTLYNITSLLPATYYKYYVQTVCCNYPGTSPWSPQQYLGTLALPVCNAPASAQTTGITQTGATFTWSAVDGACSYKGIYYPMNNSGTSTTFTTTVTSFTVSTLQPNTSYHWVVQTVCCSGNTSTNYTGQYFTTLPATNTSCNPPRIYNTLHITSTSAVLTWSKVDGACSYNLVYYTPSAQGYITLNIKDTTVVLSNLLPGVEYHWMINTLCCNGYQGTNGTMQIFKTLPAATCVPPVHFIVVAATQSTVTLAWNKAPNACGYKLIYYFGTNPAPTPAIVIITNPTDTVFTITNLSPNTTYNWQVATNCCTSAGLVTYSDFGPVQTFKTLVAPPTCTPPANMLTDGITQTGALLKWNKVPHACSYVVYYATANSTTPAFLTVTTKDTSVSLSGLVPNTYYYWKVKTICCDLITGWQGESDLSPTVYFKTLPQTIPPCTAPVSFYTTRITMTSAYIYWNKVENSCAYYLVYYPTNNPTAYQVITLKDTTAFLLTGLLQNTEYQWKVRTICCAAAGGTSNYSDFGAIQTFKTIAPPPPVCPAPKLLKDTLITSTTALLGWLPVPGALAYTVSYWSAGNASTPVTVNVTTSYASITGLLPYTTYEWKVRSICSTDLPPSDWSTVLSFTTLPAHQLLCNPPQGPLTVNITQTGAKLTWHGVKNSCGYIVVVYSSSNTAYKTIQTKDTTVTLDGLNANSYYAWKVQTQCCDATINWQGVSDFTTPVYFLTLPVPPPPACNPPVGFHTTGITQSGAAVSWNKQVGSCGYYIIYYPLNSTSAYKVIQTKDTSLVLSSLLPGTVYQWKVRTLCCDASGALISYSDYGTVQQFTTLQPVLLTCNVPLHPATGSVTQISAVATWNKVEHACGYVVIVYPLDNTLAYQMITVKDTSVVLSNLSPNTYYQWKVKTICCIPGSNAQGESDFTPVLTFRTLPTQQADCKAPVELSSKDITLSSAVLIWNKVPTADIYLVEYWASDNANAPVYVKTQDTTISLTGLLSNTKYIWQVKTYCKTSSTATDISSDWSLPAAFTTLLPSTHNCNAPSGLTAIKVTQNAALLAWNKVSNSSSYIIEYYPKGSPTAVKLAYTMDTTFAALNLMPNTDYVWMVRSVCCGPTPTSPCYQGDLSAPQDFLTLPVQTSNCLAPSNPVADNITSTSATLKWFHADNACYYQVYYTSEITMQPGFIVVSTKDTSVTLSNLIANMKYDWKVKTICCSTPGTVSESDFTGLQIFSTLPPQQNTCNAPTVFASGSITQSSAVLSWNASGNACYYLIVYYPTGSSTSAWKYVKSSVPTVTLTGLNPNTAYQWEVKTICCDPNGGVVGESAFGVLQSLTTLTGQDLTCNPPSKYSSGAITATSATLKWDSVPHACVYVVVVYPANDSTSSNVKYLKTGVPLLKVDGLLPNTLYKWKVKTYCCNANAYYGGSAYGPVQTFTTLLLPPVACVPPVHLGTSNITAICANVNWSSVKNSPSYLLFVWTDSLHIKSIVTSDTVNPLLALTPATVYHWKVRSVCYSAANTNPSFSDFSPVQTFTTLAVPEVPCNPPTNLASDGVTAHSANVGWTGNDNAKYYLILYKPSASASGYKFATSVSPKFLLNGLMANTAYMWKVKSVCMLSNMNSYKFSDYSVPAYFATIPDTAVHACYAPANLVNNDITDTTVVLSWNPVAGSKLYAVVYNEAQSSAIKYKISDLPILPLGELKPGTKYIWKVATICSLNAAYSFSNFSDTASFVTTKKTAKKFNSLSANLPEMDMSIYPNPTDGLLNINIYNSSSITTLSLFNIAGQAVYTSQLSALSSQLSIDLSSYSKGVYFLKAENNNAVITKKIIVH